MHLISIVDTVLEHAIGLVALFAFGAILWVIISSAFSNHRASKR